MTSDRTVVCTIAAGPHRDLNDIARPSLEAFAAQHDYDLVVSHDDHARGRPPAWGKVVLLRELLDSHARVVWIDADAIVVDGAADIFAGAVRHRPLRLVVHRYDGLEVPNTGVLTLTSGRWATRLLDRVWARERWIEHKWWENAAILDVLGYDVDRPQTGTRRLTRARGRVGELDPRWNSVASMPVAQPRIVHFAGASHADRLVGMQRIAEGLVTRSADDPGRAAPSGADGASPPT